MSRVLLVTTDYPPLAGTNTRRVAAFAKYLPRFGWQPSIITMAIEDMPMVERGWSEDEETSPVIRLRSFAPQAVMRRLKATSPRGAGGAVGARSTAKPGTGSSSRKPIWKRLARWPWAGVRYAERALFHIPDLHRIWAMSAARAIIKEIKRGGVAAVVTSAPPFSAHMAGLAVRRRTGVPWIADFRDLWVGRPYRELAFLWHDRLDRRYERFVTARADSIVVASPRWRKTLVDRYGDAVDDKIECILNGYDAEVGATVPRPSGYDSGSPLKLVYTGALCTGARPWPLVNALSQLAAEYEGGLKGRIELTLIGDAADETPLLKALSERGPLSGIVHFSRPLPYKDCLAAQSEADVLVLFSEPLHTDTIRGKSFEYMATGRPILALLPHESAQEEVLQPSGLATIVPYEDVTAIAGTIRTWLEYGVPAVIPSWSYIHGLNREAQTQRLASILDKMALRRNPNVPLRRKA